MILTVTLNAAVDKTYRIEGFALDRVHRPSEWRIVAGGKGINVARVYKTLGGEALATGFLGGYNGRFIARSLQEEGIPARFVQTAEESRVCIAVVDPNTGTQTEVNEAGPTVTAREIDNLFRTFRRLLREHALSFVTLSGSIPPGVPPSIYAELISVARAAGVRVALDASGEALRLGVQARPWMVKPNIHELGQLTGEHTDGADVIRAAQELVASGIEIVCVTQGREPCTCVTVDGIWQAAPPEIAFVSAVGSGDSFLAAFLWALEAGQQTPDALRLAVGAGAANAATWGAGFCTEEQIRRCCDKVEVTAIS